MATASMRFGIESRSHSNGDFYDGSELCDCLTGLVENDVRTRVYANMNMTALHGAQRLADHKSESVCLWSCDAANFPYVWIFWKRPETLAMKVSLRLDISGTVNLWQRNQINNKEESMNRHFCALLLVTDLMLAYYID
ncbi:hypothetical protein KIN20_025631 [Parelaphostrongylus tenuis]|uniref:Uncharacterized protein n=1 Tax=Parelaphostrongylus tenuis TaxID=148309 RepID=A0AAD5N919_PARTN|nr:hypothetical protein KIN20_025631 [Parelaphostrongylus tenuis]